MSAWGQELKRARLREGMQYVKDLAAASGVHAQTIYKLESGKTKDPNPDTLRALRRVLPNLPIPLEVVSGEDRITVTLPSDPDERAAQLLELLRQTQEEQSRRNRSE